MDDTKYRVIAETAEGHQMTGSAWETRFIDTTLATNLDYDAACAAIAEFKRASRGGEGKTFKRVYMIPEASYQAHGTRRLEIR